MLRITSAEFVRRPGVLFARLALSFIVPSLVVLAGAVKNERLRVREYPIEIARGSSSLTHLRILFASDFHLGRMTGSNLLRRFVDKVNALDPDIVLIGGDVLEGDRDDDTSEFASQFRRLRSKYGVYGVPGNHEMHGRTPIDFFSASGVTLLNDVTEKIGGAFYLVGRSDGHSGTRAHLDTLLRGLDRDLPVIVLDHRPADFENAVLSGVDLQLSGHTHNGQLFPVNLLYPAMYELPWGHLKRAETHFIVSSGVQVWGPPVRTAGDSEIVLVNVFLRGQRRDRHRAGL